MNKVFGSGKTLCVLIDTWWNVNKLAQVLQVNAMWF